MEGSGCVLGFGEWHRCRHLRGHHAWHGVVELAQQHGARVADFALLVFKFLHNRAGISSGRWLRTCWCHQRSVDSKTQPSQFNLKSETEFESNSVSELELKVLEPLTVGGDVIYSKRKHVFAILSLVSAAAICTY